MEKKVVYFGADWCADCKRVKQFLVDNTIAYENHDVDNEPGAREKMRELNDNKDIIPTLVVDGKVFLEPSSVELKTIFESTSTEMNNEHEVIMIGAGPTALAAAVYTTREDIDTLLFEKGVIGGLAAITDWVDNYPGFPEGVAGLDLAENLQKQAERFGTKIELGEVSSIQKEDNKIKLQTTSGDFFAKAVLIATGSDYKKLGVPGEDTFYGRGVHFCATCDGAFYRDKHVIVVGGGNSAAQEALFLTKFASQIEMLVRGNELRASEVLQHELEKNDKITVHFNTTTDEIVGDSAGVNKVIGTDTKTNNKVEFATDGVFVFIGLKPNTGFLKGSGVELDEIGLVKTNQDLETALEGVFAAGDVRSGATMQIASAVGEGATAALHIREYLESKNR
jgi:thioredoxin reductase (NADPH)